MLGHLWTKIKVEGLVRPQAQLEAHRYDILRCLLMCEAVMLDDTEGGDRRAKMKETSHQMHEPGDYNCRYNLERKEEGEEYGSYG